ncbi:MAG: hypothetical protein JXO72_16280 [Vicinamibacteria bacterium]|nr:hypothetical protein [Vicinamibacteria bacterium]
MTRRFAIGLAMISAVLGLTSPCRGASATAPIAASEQETLLEKSLAALSIEIGGSSRGIAEIHIRGLRTIDDEALLRLLAARLAPPVTTAKAVELMRALASTGLFAGITPKLRLPMDPESGLMLELLVEEHPVVRDVVIRGSGEIAEREILNDLVSWPSCEIGADAAAEDGTRPTCVPVEWYARLDDSGLLPGILWHGPSGAARRVLGRLFESGYRMATVTAECSPQGTLSLVVDEGLIDEIRVSGVAASLVNPVRESLSLTPGRVFLDADVAAAIKRVGRDFPFLRPAPASRPTRALPDFIEETSPDGGIRATARERTPEIVPAASHVVAGRVLEVFFRPTFVLQVGLLADDILRNTPVGGAGFGVQLRLALWDSQNRVHLQIENYGGAVDEKLLETLDKEVGENALRLRFQIPSLRVAELGVEVRNWIETTDQWRMDRHESYLCSLLFNKPEMEYYWNEGDGFFLTLLPTKRLIVGSEYQFGKHRSAPSIEKPHAFFGGGKPWPNAAIDDGTIGALLFRLEWSSDPVDIRSLGGVFHSNETSLMNRPRSWGLRTAFHTLNTLEIASPDLDSANTFDFTRFLSDNKLILATGARSGLRLRLRVMHGTRLPRQRKDGLGGWSALRGFDFKEFRGDRSVLGMIEYRQDWISGFVDVGSVRETDRGWTGPHFGAGAKLHLDQLSIFKDRLRIGPLQLVAAWRLDDKIKAAPEIRLQFGHLF